MRVRMRQAQRQMKGTKLQYLDQMPVLFSDVAGVPGAKVRFLASARRPKHDHRRFLNARPEALTPACVFALPSCDFAATFPV